MVSTESPIVVSQPLPPRTVPLAVFGASLGMAGFGNAFLFWKIFLPELASFTDAVLSLSRWTAVAWLGLGILQGILAPRRLLREFCGPEHVAFAPGFMSAALLVHVLHDARIVPEKVVSVLFYAVVVYAFTALVVFIVVAHKHGLLPEPCWYPVIVGIGVLADPGAADGCVQPVHVPICPQVLALCLLWWSAISTLALAPVVTYRVFRKGPLVADNPTVAILVAPFSLTQLAWFACYSAGLQPGWPFEHVFYAGSATSFLLTIAAIMVRRGSALKRMLPQHAAFTFPLVATAATACKYWHIHSDLTKEGKADWSAGALMLARYWALMLLLITSIVIPCFNTWLLCHIVRNIARRVQGAFALPAVFGVDGLGP